MEIKDKLYKLLDILETKQLAKIFKDGMEAKGIRKLDRRRKDNSKVYMIDGDTTNWNRVECYYRTDNKDWNNSDLEITLRKRAGYYLILEYKGERVFERSWNDIVYYNEEGVNELVGTYKKFFDELFNLVEQRDSLEFLEHLKHEMLAQDTVGQADPRFWVVMHTKRVYGIESEYHIDGTIITCNEDPETEVETDMKSIYEFLTDDLDINCDYGEGIIHVIDDNEDLTDLDEVMDYLGDDYYLVNYRDEEEIVKNTFFLTKDECEKHIQRNSYHYNKPHPYAMTAWRSPQVEKLYKIIQNMDWLSLWKN